VARQAVAAQLAEVFGVAVPVPVAAVFKPWARGTTLWRVDVDKAHTLAILRRPLGPSVPVMWGNADADPTWGGWVEGAVAQGNALAAAALAPASVIPHGDGS
jgi:monoamine oxidase